MKKQLRKLLEDLEEGKITESEVRSAIYHQILIISEEVLSENNITIDYDDEGLYMLLQDDEMVDDEMSFVECHLEAFKLINESE